MHSFNRIMLAGALICSLVGVTMAQEGESDAAANRTMRPVVRGQHFAAAAMKAEATRAAERILEKGGNAFDAIVAGQAVLGIVDPAMNGVGSDATLLVYDAKTKKVYSINAEGTAPKLATIDWYKKNQDGKIPVNDTLLSATVPGVVDAWYIMLSRWGTRTFAELLAPAIEIAEKGMPVTRTFASAALLKYPSSAAVYRPPDGTRWNDGEVWKNPDL